MPYIPPEVLQEIKKVDLKTYLKEYEPRELVLRYFAKNLTESHI